MKARGQPNGNPTVDPRSGVAGQAVEQLLAEVVEETQPQAAGSKEELRGAIALVTGGATGIGRAIVL